MCHRRQVASDIPDIFCSALRVPQPSQNALLGLLSLYFILIGKPASTPPPKKNGRFSYLNFQWVHYWETEGQWWGLVLAIAAQLKKLS